MKTVWEMDAGGGGGVAGYETNEDVFLGVGCGSPEDDKNHSTSVQTSTSVQSTVPARGCHLMLFNVGIIPVVTHVTLWESS